MKTTTAILVGGLATLVGGLGAWALIPDERRDALRQEESSAIVEHETARVEASARAFSRAVNRRDGQLICKRMLTPETVTRLESTTGKRCTRFYRELRSTRGRMLIDRTKVYGRTALLDIRNTNGSSAVLVFLRSSEGRWLFLRRLTISPDPQPAGRDALPQGRPS